VCAGRIHSARDVCKVHPYRLDAFSSGDAGPRGWVEEGRVRWDQPGSWPTVHAGAQRALDLPATDWPWVEVVHNHAGADARHLELLVSAGVRGLVVAGTGNGTVHQSLLNALARAQARGVAVRLVSRCAEGRVVGQIAPDGLQPFKARISLMLDLLG